MSDLRDSTSIVLICVSGKVTVTSDLGFVYSKEYLHFVNPEQNEIRATEFSA
jgi:hypothetical protein